MQDTPRTRGEAGGATARGGRVRRVLRAAAPNLPLAAAAVFLGLKQVAMLQATVLSIGEPAEANLYLASLATALLFVPWAFVLRGRRVVLGLAAVDAAITLVFQADLLYYRQFSDLVSSASLRYAGLLGDVFGAVLALFRARDVLLWVDVVLLLGAAVLVPRRRARGGPAPRRLLSPTAAAVTSLVALIALGTATATTRRIRGVHGGHTALASAVGLVGYHLFDATTYLVRLASRLHPSEEVVEAERAWIAARPAPVVGPLTGVAHGRSVVVVQVEALQSFARGLSIGGAPITPNLDRLAKESLDFRRFYSQVGQGTTADAELLTNCSLYPLRTGAVYWEHADGDYLCLPELLRRQGYHTVAMHSNRPEYWNRSAMYPRIGIERYYDERDFVQDQHMGMGLSDGHFLDQAVDKLLRTKQPYYAFLLTLSSHMPFNGEGIPKTPELGALEGTLIAAYLHAIHYTDAALGHFVDRLREAGVLDRIVLVVYGDHQGIATPEPEVIRALGLPLSRADGSLEFQRRVPLLVRLPGGEGAVYDAPRGQVDLAPTIQDLLGLPRGPLFMGRSLLEPGDRPVVFSRGSAIEGSLTWLSDDRAFGASGCFGAGAERLADDRCAALAARADEALEASRRLVDLNLARRLVDDPEAAAPRLASGPERAAEHAKR